MAIDKVVGFGSDMLQMMKERMRSLLRYPDDYFTTGLWIERGQVRKDVQLLVPATVGEITL